MGLPALERGGATTFCLRHLPQVCSALPCMSDCDPPCSAKTHALPRTCSRFVRHEPCTLSTCSRVRFTCVSAQVCIQSGFEGQFSTAGDAAASKHGFWLLMKVRPKICILHKHYKNTLGVTPRVTPSCGVTPGVIDYSRGVTRERSNCEEESYVIAWTSNCTHFELRITYTRYSVRAPTVHPSYSRELLPGSTWQHQDLALHHYTG